MTRQEAIGALKEKLDYYERDKRLKAACETLIPELRESEDERIRKELLEEIEFIIPHEDETDSEGLILPSYRTRIKRYKSYLEKQKEQEHNEGDFTIYHPLKNGKGEYECIPYSFYGSLTSFSEDKDLIDFLRTCFYTEEECNEWIKQQKEQKPAEWNEEDEDFINMLILHFNYLIHKGGDSVETYKSYIEKLKSLRPPQYCENCKLKRSVENWKPSEEQMDALNEVINTLAVSKYPHESDYLFNILNGLRKNLKSYSHEIH